MTAVLFASLTLALSALGGSSSAAREDPRPAPQNQPWRFEFFDDDAELSGAFVFFIDFEADGTVWVAASDGLRRYDGYRWHRFDTADGLPSDYVRCVLVDRDGRIWVGTDRGAGVFDGQRFQDVGATENLPGPSVRRIVQDPDGSLWFCCDRWPDPPVSAGLARLADGEWTRFGLADGLPSDYVSDVRFDSRGGRYVLTRRGLAQLDGDRLRRPLEEAGLPGADDYVWSLVELPDGRLLVATAAHFYVGRGQSWSVVPNEPNIRNPVLEETADGTIVACRSGSRGRMFRWAGAGFEPCSPPWPRPAPGIQTTREAPDGSLWIGGSGILARWQRRGGSWTVYRDLPGPAHEDSEGGIWFAGGGRVLRKHGEVWTGHSKARSILAREPDGAGLWLESREGLLRWSPATERTFPAAETGLSAPSRAAFDDLGRVWVAGHGERGEAALSRYEVDRGWTTLPVPSGVGTVTSMVGNGTGVFVLTAGPDRTRFRLHRIDAEGPREILLPDSAQLHLSPRVHVERGGDLWCYGFFGLSVLARGTEGWRSVPGLPGRHLDGATAVGEDVWFSSSAVTGGTAALSMWRDGAWTHHRDIVARPVSPPGGTGLFGAAGRLYVVRPGAERPEVLTVPASLPVASALEARDGSVWVGVGDQVMHYRSDGQAPETILVAAPEEVGEGGDLTVEVSGRERFVSSTTERRFQVEQRLDDGPWEPAGTFHRGSLVVRAPAVGAHELLVRVRDEGGDVDRTPARLRFRVLPLPLQSRAWFAPAVAGLLLTFLGLSAFGLMTRRRLRLQARDLERTVARRTAELGGSEGRYRTLFEQSRDAILFVDLAGRIRDANPAACRLLERAEEDLAGRPVRQLLAGLPELESDATAGFVRELCVELGGAASQGGRPRVLVRANQIRSGRDEPLGHQIVIRDVTVQTIAEERLRETQKMEAIGRMAGGIAHDFNNILTAIFGQAELLLERFAEVDEGRDEVRQLLRHAERAKSLTRQIQTISRSSESFPGIVDPNEVIEGTMDLLRSAVGEDVRVSLELHPGVGRIRIDPGSLEQVLLNLALNARDAMPDGGELTLRTTEGPGDGPGSVLLRVTDSGQGMGSETLRKIFEPFFTTKPPGEGTGLGLAIVYGIVDRWGGTIQVESELGRGTSFDVVFPVTVEKPEPELLPVAPLERPDGDGAILVVEDEPAIRELIARCLEARGYRVDLAADADEALQLCTSSERRFDLVVSDVVMPGMSGPELRHRLQDQRPELRWLFMSGYVTADEEGELPPSASVLRKPFPLSVLVRAVSEVLALGPRTGATPVRLHQLHEES